MPYEVAIEGELRMSSPFNAGIKQAYEKPYGFVLASSICRQVHPFLHPHCRPCVSREQRVVRHMHQVGLYLTAIRVSGNGFYS